MGSSIDGGSTLGASSLIGGWTITDDATGVLASCKTMSLTELLTLSLFSLGVSFIPNVFAASRVRRLGRFSVDVVDGVIDGC